MAEKNPFDLSGRDGGPGRPQLGRTWTPEEQAEKLSGYLEISPEFWEQIRYGTHLRYYLKTGEYRSGGFVLKNPFDTRPKGQADEKRFLKLQNSFDTKNKNYQQWLLAYEDADKIFIKPDAAVLMVLRSLDAGVRGLNENIRKVVDHSKKLEVRLQALETRVQILEGRK